jgi:ankyrin repeat protein
MERIVLLLLERGAAVNASGGRCEFALHAALTNGHGKIAQLLIENGADVNVLGKNLCCPLELAAYMGDENLVRLLINNSADPNAHGGMALLRASWDGHEIAVRVLLNKGADANLQNKKYGSALLAAFDGGNRAIVQLLVKYRAKVDWSGLHR